MGSFERTNWIWTPEWQQQDNASPRLVYFRKRFYLNAAPSSAMVRISADTRYKLYVNGTLVQSGPSKGDRQVWYTDEMDVSSHLRPGENVMTAAVLRYPAAGLAGNHSMFRTHTPGLFVKGCAVSGSGERLADLSADESWRCHIDRETTFYAEEEDFAPLIIHEHAAVDPTVFRWKDVGFGDSEREQAKPYSSSEIPETLSPARLTPLYEQGG